MLLVPRHFSSSRRFPHLSWAWPDGLREVLLVAAAHADEERAAQAFLDWLSAVRLDDATFAEQRLLVGATNRFPETRLKVPERARLNGVVRMLWTKSRLALNDAAPVLKELRAAGAELLVLKGMAQAALDLRNLKGRIAHDIDILVRPADLQLALSVLDRNGWRSSRGESGLLLKARGASFRSLNFQKAPFGDIDVHTRAYLTASPLSPAETGLWARSTPAKLLDVDVVLPSPTDRLVNAVAHGVLDAHRHSDWLVDGAQLLREGGIDWPLVAALAEDLAVPAQVTLALYYLREVLSCAVPDDILTQLWERARSHPGDYFKALLLGYPRAQHSLVTRAGRRIFKLRHRAQVRAINGSGTGSGERIRMRRTRQPGPFPAAPPGLRHRLDVRPGATRCSIVVEMEGTGRARRYVFEINTDDRHLAQLSFTDRLGHGRLVRGASIALPGGAENGNVWIEARQSGILPPAHSRQEQARFGPRPFRVLVR
jgi:hypothetical protein